MESNPFRMIPLLIFSSPCRGIIFSSTGAFEKTTHLETDFEEAGLWLDVFGI